jgi:hypothetical protein
VTTQNIDEHNSHHKSDAEYAYVIEDQEIWFIDYIICIAFRTPISFRDRTNSLSDSGRTYNVFSDYKQLQDYLEEKTGGQEIVIESSIDPNTKAESNSRIIWSDNEVLRA